MQKVFVLWLLRNDLHPLYQSGEPHGSPDYFFSALLLVKKPAFTMSNAIAAYDKEWPFLCQQLFPSLEYHLFYKAI